jgi:hypothetical protein
MHELRGIKRITYIKTQNGGESWQIVFQIEEDIKAISFVDELTGYVVGDAGVALKTIDGGQSFKPMTAPYIYYVDVHFVTSDLGYVLGDYGELYMTKNGGGSWEAEPFFYGVYELQKINSFGNNVFVAGEFGNIYRSAITIEDFSQFTSLNVTNVTETSAEFRGTISTKTHFDNASVILEIGTSSAVYSEPIQVTTISGSGEFTVEKTLTGLEPGETYFSRMTVLSGNEKMQSLEIAFTTMTNILDIERQAGMIVSVYPNPVADFLHLNIEHVASRQLSLELVDIMGRPVRSLITSPAFEINIDVSTLKAGIYLLNITSSNAKKTIRVIKKN